MLRRKFIQSLVLLTGGVFTAKLSNAFNDTQKVKLKGKVLSLGKGIKNVIVSDGFSVTSTDDKGKYELKLHPRATAVYVSTPSGYAFTHQNNIAKHYSLLNEINVKDDLDFNLEKLEKNDDEHEFIIWADPQIKNAKDVYKLMNESVPDVQKFVTGTASGALLHGITVGDIVWDEHHLFKEYNNAVQKMGIPFFQCLGNHDMDVKNGTDEDSDDTFQKNYGPTYYSFNRGEAHYVVMDNVRYLGRDREYDGYIVEQQLAWLKKDLSFVPKDKLIILCIHIPVHSGTKNKEELYALLQGRDVHIMSGHTHYHKNVITDNIYEHNHGTVCGAWWTGPICEDGTPGGYGTYKVKGNKLEWKYKSTGKDINDQMKLFISDADNNTKLLQANIWNYDAGWQTSYSVDGIDKGALIQFAGIDPFALQTMLGPDLPKPRSFAEPKVTDHLFKALIPASAKNVVVNATDRFGNKYSVSQNI